jgi:hypothetical protein
MFKFPAQGIRCCLRIVWVVDAFIEIVGHQKRGTENRVSGW